MRAAAAASEWALAGGQGRGQGGHFNRAPRLTTRSLKRQLARREKEAAAALAPLKPFEAAARQAERELNYCRRSVEAAEKAAAHAEKRLEK